MIKYWSHNELANKHILEQNKYNITNYILDLDNLMINFSKAKFLSNFVEFISIFNPKIENFIIISGKKLNINKIIIKNVKYILILNPYRLEDYIDILLNY